MGQCGGCGLKVRFWGVDGARVTCPNCGLDHEVEAGEMEDLTTGEKSEVALLVPMKKVSKDRVNGKCFEQRN